MAVVDVLAYSKRFRRTQNIFAKKQNKKRVMVNSYQSNSSGGRPSMYVENDGRQECSNVRSAVAVKLSTEFCLSSKFVQILMGRPYFVGLASQLGLISTFFFARE